MSEQELGLFDWVDVLLRSIQNEDFLAYQDLPEKHRVDDPQGTLDGYNFINPDHLSSSEKRGWIVQGLVDELMKDWEHDGEWGYSPASESAP